MAKPFKNSPRKDFNSIIYPDPDKVIDAASGRTLLIDAILTSDLEKVERLLESGAHPAKPDTQGKSPLHYAARLGQTDVIDLLLKHKALVDPRDAELATPLFEAVHSRRKPTETILCLLRHKADANIPDDRGRIPLHDAAEKLGPDSIRLLARASKNPGHADDEMMTPLHLACLQNNLAAVEALISAGVPVTAENEAGDTPLHLAAQRADDSSIAMHLLSTEAAQLINAPRRDGKTPLHLAIINNRADLIEAMLKKGADPNATDKTGLSVLIMAAQQWNVPEKIIRLLLENGADVNKTWPQSGGTALHQTAAAYNNTPILKTLLEYNADPNARDSAGNTPLWNAIMAGNTPAISLLLKSGASPDAPNQQGLTPLQQSSAFNMIDIVLELLQHKADPNRQAADGRTALHMIINRGYTNLEVVRALLNAGADPLKKDNSGRSPCDTAYEYGEQAALDLLKKKLKEKGLSYTPDPNRPAGPPTNNWGRGPRF